MLACLAYFHFERRVLFFCSWTRWYTYRLMVKPMASSRKNLLLTEKMLQDWRFFRSVKNPRMVNGIKGRKTTLGCRRAKMMATMQKRN